MVDTATEAAPGVDTAVVGAILVAMLTGSITAARGSRRASQCHRAVTPSGWILTVASALPVDRGFLRPRMAGTASADAGGADEG